MFRLMVPPLVELLPNRDMLAFVVTMYFMKTMMPIISCSSALPS